MNLELTSTTIQCLSSPYCFRIKVVGGDADSLQVRTVVLAPDGVDEAPMES